MERAEQKEQILSPAQAEAGLESTQSSIAKMDEFDATLYFLDDREVEYLQGEIKREFSTDLRPAVIASAPRHIREPEGPDRTRGDLRTARLFPPHSPLLRAVSQRRVLTARSKRSPPTAPPRSWSRRRIASYSSAS